MKRLTFLFILFSISALAQKIDVANVELSVKAGEKKQLYYTFDAGDKILFAVDAGADEIDEFSIVEYPENIRFQSLVLKKERKEIAVNNKAVYIFNFSNNGKETETYSLKIVRTPVKNGKKDFNTGVAMTRVQDTVWNTVTKDVIVGYDTIFVQKTRKVVVSEKKYEEIVLDKSQRVNSKTTLGENRTSVSFSLPKDLNTKEETKKVVAWAYWVGVGEESNEFWKQNRKMIVGAVQGAATYFTTPLGGIAAGAATNLLIPTNGEDVEYAIVNEANNKLFTAQKTFKSYDNGKGVAAYKRFTDADMLQGKFYVVLTNDNFVQPIDVNVKVSAIIENIKYKEETYTDRQIKPRLEKKIVREPQINTRIIPVPAQG